MVPGGVVIGRRPLRPGGLGPAPICATMADPNAEETMR